MSGPAPSVLSLRDGRSVTVRAATPDDAQAALDYMHAELPELQEFIMTTPGEFEVSLEEERELFASYADADDRLWLLACDGGRVVGMLSARASERRRMAHVAELGMTLHRGCRGQGLGRAMMRALIAWAEGTQSLERLTLTAYADNEPALALYRGCGFLEAGRIPAHVKFGPGRYKDLVTMWRDVRPARQKGVA